MAGSPRYKVYVRDYAQQPAPMIYVAACKEPGAACVVASFYGPGAEVRDGHAARHVVWSVDRDDPTDSTSHDERRQLIFERALRAKGDVS